MLLLAILCCFLMPGNLTFSATALMFAVPTRGIRWEWHHIFFIAWISWAAIGCISSPWSEMAIYGHSLRMEGLLTWIVLARMAWLTWEIICSWGLLLAIMAVATAVVAICGVTNSELASQFTMPVIAMANLTAILVVIVWAFDWRVAVICMPACLACNTRGAVVGMLAGILVQTVIRSKFVRLKTWSITAIFLGCIVLASPVGAKFLKINTATIGTGPRAQWAMQSVKAIRERPMLGFGLDTLSHVLTQAKGEFSSQTTRADRTHNVILDMMLQTGVVGLALGIATFLAAAYRAFKTRTFENSVALSVMVAWVVLGMFNPAGVTATLVLLMAIFVVNKERL